ncbi:MAG: hypothetical protein A2170_09715 [Deltaproteobacteria bacterium RBG_13_53_10]|nr:MAG: hypothetical protein A2170_09715 [Deltaproteobacteria bacterium RBG_13_53_10]
MTESEKRSLPDRRKSPTIMLSWHTLWGRRRDLRRKLDQQKGGYVDRYSSGLFFFLVLVMSLNILDVLFTLMIIDHRGWEANPIVGSVMELHGELFWIWKFLITSACLVLLCLHSKFRLAQAAIIALASIYVLLIFYQVFLLIRL